MNGRVSKLKRKRSHSPNAIVIYNSYHLKRSEQIRSLCDGRNVCLFVWLSERVRVYDSKSQQIIQLLVVFVRPVFHRTLWLNIKIKKNKRKTLHTQAVVATQFFAE